MKDIIDAFDWYEDRREGLGSDFAAEVRKYLSLIRENPDLFQSRRPQRFAHMRRFPFKISFDIESTTISVRAVYHTSRNPQNLNRD